MNYVFSLFFHIKSKYDKILSDIKLELHTFTSKNIIKTKQRHSSKKKKKRELHL